MDFSSPRNFRVWFFHVSHNQLLLRAPKGGEEEKNIDLIFKGVFYMEIANTLEGVEFISPNAEEIKYLEEKSQTKQSPTDIFYKLRSNEKDYYIGAVVVIIDINELELFETNMEFPTSFKPIPGSFPIKKPEF